MKHLKVHLGETEYTIPELDIGQLEDVTAVFEGPLRKVAYSTLAIALQRATPPVADIRALQARHDQVMHAANEILIFSGFKKRDADKDADPNELAPKPGAES
jgi:hypothetical protein